jgi:dienelactone hydrolase
MKRAALLFIVCAVVSAEGAPAAKGKPASIKAPSLSPLLVRPDGSAISTIQQWEAYRETLKRKWAEVLGELPVPGTPLKPRVIGTEDLEGFTRKHVVYEVEPGVEIDGYLLSPKAPGKKPGLVVFHATTPFGAEGPAGLAPDYPAEKRHGMQMVQQGFVVWCPRNYINGKGADWAGNAQKVLARHPSWTGMTRMVLDALRAVDYLASVPEVDPDKIGCFGHSLGAKQVLFAMAFDERLKAGVFSEGGVGLKFSNWNAVWYLGPKIDKEGFARDNHELLALAAPRPLLVIAGDSADTDESRAYVNAVLPVYTLLGAPTKIEFLNHHAGHAYGPEARPKAEHFLKKWLGPEIHQGGSGK